ncbi:MAG: PAS domain-containing protein [Limnospira sp.]
MPAQLNDILKTAIRQVRELLRVDRAIAYRFEPDLGGAIVAESTVPEYPPCLNTQITEPCFQSPDIANPYREGKTLATADIYAAELNPCHREMLERFQVRANLVVPILLPDAPLAYLWGLLIVHQCDGPREWGEADIRLLQQLSVQVAVTIQQSELYQRALALNSTLEQKVAERTRELQTLARRERLMSQIATQIRASLDLPTILDATVEGLTEALACDRVIIYQFRPDLSGIVVAEAISEGGKSVLHTEVHDPCVTSEWIEPYRQGQIRVVNDIYESSMTRCHQEMLLSFDIRAKLMAPVVVDGQLWGLTIASHRNRPRQWQPEDIELLRQISTQVAIAIGQATAYETARNELAERQKAEIKLRESERRYASLVAASPVGIFQTDAGGFCTYINDRCCEMLGLTPETARGRRWEESLHPEDRDRVAAEWNRSVAENRLFQLEYRFLRSDGKITWVYGQCVPEVNEGGEVVGYLGTVTDISEQQAALRERRRAELTLERLNRELENRVESRTAKLQESREQLRHLSDRLELAIKSGAIGIWDWDVTHNTLTWDDRMYELYGVAPEEFGNIYDAWADRVHPDDRLSAERAIAEALGGEKDYDPEFRVILPGGGVRHIKGYALVNRDSNGNPERMIGINYDISDRKRAEETRLKREAHLRTAQRIGQLGSWELEVASGRVTWSEETFRIFGLQPKTEAPSLEAISQLFHPDDRPIHETAIEGAIASASAYDLEARIRRGDGIWIDIVARGEPLFDAAGNVAQFVGTVQDVTQRKLAERQLQEALEAAEYANRAKSEFLALMSHEIRTPMNAILGLTYLALKTDLSPLQADYLSKIEISAQSLLQIINDILDFSKIEAGKLELESAPFELDEILNNISNILALKAVEKGIELIFRTGDDVPPILIGDSLRLSQVLMNLTGNAVKFTPEGSVLVSVETLNRTEGMVRLKFTVRDTGIGLSPSQRSSLFEAFTQADTSTTRKYSGTGLGLAICKRLVNLMGGEICVESELGRGSTFDFQIQFGYLCDVNTRSGQAPVPDLGDLKSLVVDDNPQVREILTEILESFSLRVTSTSSGSDALELLRLAPPEDPFELVLMDWCMPTLDGIETSRQIKADPRLSHIPHILMVTAYHRQDIWQLAAEVGIDMVLPKPIDRSRLFDSILQVFGYGVVTQKQRKRPAVEPEMLSAIRDARILLVEDNEVNQQIAVELLAAAGMDVDVAWNGLEAIEKVRSSSYDLILMDVRMPKMDGRTATRKIRSLAAMGEVETERFATVPIVAMTAHAMSTDRAKSLEAGMNDHVSKPIEPPELYGVLAKWIVPTHRDSRPALTAGRLESPAAAVSSKPGLNVELGISRIGGNLAAYRRLLCRFRTVHAESASEIRAAMEKGDRAVAFNGVHSLKGAAGNIGADGLYRSADRLERELRREISQTSPIGDLSRDLAEVMDGIDALLVEWGEPESEPESAAPPLDVAAIAQIIADIIGLLEVDLGEATARLETLRRRAGDTPLRDRAEAIAQRLAEFDTDGAENLLRDLKKTLENY